MTTKKDYRTCNFEFDDCVETVKKTISSCRNYCTPKQCDVNIVEGCLTRFSPMVNGCNQKYLSCLKLIKTLEAINSPDLTNTVPRR